METNKLGGGIPPEVLKKWAEIWDRNNRAGRRGILVIDSINFGRNIGVKYWNEFHGDDGGTLEIIQPETREEKK